MPSSTSLNTSSGIATTPSGVRHIPSSTRADGSTRKEIRIRPGYKPPEDVEVYKNRTAEAWKTRGVSAGVPGAGGLEANIGSESRGTNAKTAKRREARKRAKAQDEASPTNGDAAASEMQAEILPRPNPALEENWRERLSPAEEAQDPAADRLKQARTLKKKLRQAKELREKEENGEDLLPEQFEKVIKINELIRQLDGLGFNADGERKVD